VEKAVVGAPILSVAIVSLKLEKNVMMATKSTKTVVPMPARSNARCRDGIRDDANSSNDDSSFNKNARCGNGFIQPGEDCNDRNDDNGDS
jgi:hypothetical protein